MKKIAGFALLMAMFSGVYAADYVVDGTDGGMHSAVSFRASHVGISSLWGRFNDISGSFTYDADNISASTIMVTIDPASIDTNLVARDEHLRTGDYLGVEEFPEAGFVSTSIVETGDGQMSITGDFTLHGVTNSITFDAHITGEGDTPFGDYRVGLEGETSIDVSEYGITMFPTSVLSLWLAIEGIRQ